ncbi:MAG: VanZ family protein [Mycobacterium sp.]
MSALSRSFWFALFCWAATILWLSSLAPQELPDSAFLAWDKINHVLAYALGGWLAASALRLSRPSASAVNRIIGAVILIAVFGVLDEAFQTSTPGRTGGSLGDWVADVFGAVVGALASVRTHRLFAGR